MAMLNNCACSLFQVPRNESLAILDFSQMTIIITKIKYSAKIIEKQCTVKQLLDIRHVEFVIRILQLKSHPLIIKLSECPCLCAFCGKIMMMNEHLSPFADRLLKHEPNVPAYSSRLNSKRCVTCLK